VAFHVDQDVGGHGVQKRKPYTILITEAGVATATCWWDQLTVSKSSVVLTAGPEVGLPVVLTVASAPSKKKAQHLFRAIRLAVDYSARCVDARELVDGAMG
jgi:hypothetical protein